MHQPPLFDIPDAYAATLRLEVDGTWTLVVAWRSEASPWSDHHRETYAALSLGEALQVLESVVLRVPSQLV